MYLILNVAPSILLAAMFFFRKYLVGSDFKDLKKEHISTSFMACCYAIICFNLLGSLSSQFIHITKPDVSLTPIMIVSSLVFSPLFEELLFRKMLLRQLSKRLGFLISAITISAVFALLHFDPVNFAGYFGISMIWSYAYKNSSNIFVPIFSHVLFNYFALFIASVKVALIAL